ncbi:uncharacterized protein LOC142242830 [Haematobia irritans]|uniref:uncharacterized protein LOC142242830 n=1 Tax=Haematobia irritans TaxID=7368 RepID=UPI003F4FA63C
MYFQHDIEQQTYKRFLTLSLKSAQLEKLERMEDPRDLDNVLMQIFEKAQSVPYGHSHCRSFATKATGFKALIVDLYSDLSQLAYTSEIRFLVFVGITLICGWVIHKRYHIGILALFGGSLFLFGFLHTYLECNRELEVNQMMEILQHKERSTMEQNQYGFWGYLRSFFPASKSVADTEFLKKSTKISLGFCRPDHVVIMYFNDIFLKYLEVLLQQCSQTLATLNGNLPFPLNYISGFLLIGIIGYILKLVFKYVLNPAAWAHVLHSRDYLHALPEKSRNFNPSHDCISGENLKMLLRVMNSEPNLNKVSGIEEVREAIEAVHEKTDLSGSNTKLSKKVQVNNNEAKEDFTNGVTMEDVPDEL